MRNWFTFKNAADDASTVDIQIVDVIGSWDDDWFARNFGYDMGVTARAFVEQLAALPTSVKAIRLHINSPGGDIQAGINIANALREQQLSKGRTVTTVIDGMAASIASVIAMAGSTVTIADNALVMVHNPWGLAIGNAAELRKTADVFDTMRGQIIATYQWHSKLDADALAALMDAETWMNADEAIANGFATEKVEGLKAAASIDRRAIAKLKVPDQYRDRVNAFLQPEPAPGPTAATPDEVMAECAAAGCDLEFTRALAKSGATLDQVKVKVTAAKAAKTAASARATEIAGLCATAKLPELAAGYIAGAMNAADVRTHLTTITAKLDAVEIDNSLRPDQGVRPKALLNPAAIYAARAAN